jgi:phage-related minor tail protein
VPSGAPANGPSPSAASLREVERVRARLDEEFRNSRQLERDVAAIGRGETGGSFSAEYAARLRGLAETRYGGKANDNDLTRQGLNSYDKMFIRYQGFDAGSQLYSGASPSIVAVQQGSQVLQQLADREGGLGAGLKQLGVSALGLVTPFTVATTAVVGIGGAFAAAALSAASDQAALERATKGIGAATGATASQLDAMARANAEAGKISTSTAREMTASYASTGQIALPVIGDLTRVTADYAKLVGTDVTTATADLARVFSGDLASGADELAKRIGGLDDRTRQLIQAQQEQGDKSGAQATAAEYLQSTVASNTTATYGWAAAWEEAKKWADGYWESAKKIAGIKLGAVPEGAQEAVDRLSKLLDETNNNRRISGLAPLGLGDSLVRQLDTAKLIADTERRIADGKKAEDDAKTASRTAGDLARSLDPQNSTYSRLLKQQSDLREALADPLARNKLDDLGQTESAYTAVTRAITSMTDANGKLISSEEMTRRQDQLRLDALKATTAEEKAAVAERQKAFDLIGKTITGSDARGQIERAGILARAEASSKGGGSEKESKDDFDRAVRSTEDRIRRAKEQAETYGMGAEATERFRVQQELLTAAQRAGRDVTPELTAQIEGYATQAAEAAKRVEDLRESGRTMDQYRSIGGDSVRGLVRDLGDAKSATDILGNAFDRLESRILDLASDNIAELIFGKRGTSSSGLLGSLLGGGSSGGGGEGGFSLSNIVNAISSGGFSPIPKFAGGGRVFGAGGPTDDLIPARLSAGEYVINAAAVRHYGPSFFDGLNTRSVRSFAGGGPAGGYTMPRDAAASAAGSSAPTVNFIDQRPAGSDDFQATVEPRGGGNFDVIIRGVEARMAERAAKGQGPLRQVLGGASRYRG